MIREVGEPIVVFGIPFALYALYLVIRLVNPFAIDRWTRRVLVPLTLCGVTLAVGSILLYAVTAPRYEGGYIPAHIENGQIVSGRMR